MITCSKHKSRSGVAMVITLGLMAVLMLMAVAFSIHMRIERTGASNYRYGVQARHMVWAGLANAVRDIDDIMDSDVYPDWHIKASSGSGTPASVVTKVAADFIPTAALREEARSTDAYWHYITDGSGERRGRYAFLIVNASGLLDANIVKGLTRGAGADAWEIQLDNLPDISNPSDFVTEVSTDKRYETYPELISVNQSVSDAGNLAVFSLAPISETYDAGGVTGKRAYIGADTTQWKQAEIIEAFTKSGVPNPGLAYTNLLDYVDSDSRPRLLAAGNVEKTPMINEFDFLYQITFDAGGGISGNAGLLTEWFYPFVTPSMKKFDMFYDIKVTPVVGNTVTSTVPVALTGSFSKNDFTGGSVAPRTYGTADKMVAFAGSATVNVISVKFDLTVSARINGPDGPVDEVPSPYDVDNGLKMTINIPNINRGTTVLVTNSWECLDPRFNWKPAAPQWFSYLMLTPVPGFKISPGEENTATKLYFNPPAYGMPDSLDLDDDTSMRVADEPLSSVGELGYICYDWWRTIRLYEHWTVPNPYPEANKFHRVLDYFTVSSNSYMRGLVNVNTTNVDVLASVFSQMPVEEYSSTKFPVSWAGAQQIAREIIANRPYTNLSELGEKPIHWDALMSAAPTLPSGLPHPPPVTEICKESAIRNSAGLLTARHNLFTVIIRADSFSAAMGGSTAKGVTLSSARAVAEIWRDPIADVNGNHKCLIRSLRFLED